MALVVNRPGESALALSAGAQVTRDPRRMELHPSVTTLRELAADPRLRVRTSPAAVAAGEKVARWHNR